ncbi:MAG TPA: CHAD domain-containing protein [Solirubrobacteraceae bacterium]|nr:CHAD domain-containing protein [Solirubrobacteraceae bacterium]
MAPLTVTLAATVALGLGVALARAERERRTLRERRARERHFAPLAQEDLGNGLQRMALGQLDVAIEALGGGARGSSPEQRVHEARKSLKRLRALMRLLRDELGEQVYERESALLRDTGRRLARARDAAVLLATLEGMIARDPDRLAARRGVLRLRARLQHERDGAAELALADSATQAGALADLRAMRVRVSTWRLDEQGGIEAIEPALERLYRKGRKRMRRAAKARGGRRRTRTMHEWRKRVKDLRYAAEMLDRSSAEQEAKATRKAKSADLRFAKRTAKCADDLGELLGEEHDLATLAARVRAEAKAGRASGAPGRGTRKLLLKLIAKRRGKLRKRALQDGERLYGRKPKRFLRRMRKAAALRSLNVR